MTTPRAKIKSPIMSFANLLEKAVISKSSGYL
jgi:hypothetical protein